MDLQSVKPTPHRHSFIIAAVWLLMVMASLCAMTADTDRPGAMGAAPKLFPSGTQIKLAQDRPTLIIALEPSCACSSATIGEFERVIARASKSVATFVLITAPKAKPKLWEDFAASDRMQHLPGTVLINDQDGSMAHLFGLETSGHTLLYDTKGNLKFSGGITNGRGHEGQNIAESYLEKLINHPEMEAKSFPVFGCHLAKAQKV